jgi:AcrR family transcriptional regulator
MNEKVKRGQKNPPASSGRGGAESRRRILDAAIELFARHGYAGTGLRELAAAADVNLAMINYFFGSKKGLLKEILDDFFSGYLEVARLHLEREGETADKLDAFIRAAVHYFADNRDCLVVVITELPHDDPEVIEHKAAWGRQMMAILGREICKPLSAERDRPLTPLLIGPVLTSAMASRFLFAPVSERLGEAAANNDIDSYARDLSRLLLSGLIDRN